MFGNNKDTKKPPIAVVPTSNAHNSLVKGTVVEGEIQSQSDIRIDGFVRGTILCKAKVVIGPSGVVEGTITCANAVIEGTLDGQITVAETLKLEKTAKVTAELTTNKFIVAPGAIFNGTCKMGQAAANAPLSKKDGRGKLPKKSPLKKEAS